MRGKIARAVLAALTVLVALVPVSAAAADVRQGSQVVVSPGETVQDDVYAFGGTVDIQGTVDGSVIAFGGTITVSGTINRDLIASGGTLDVTGHVGGSIRAAGGNLTLNGPVGQDVVVAGGRVTLGPNATVGRDLLLGTGTATVEGPVTRNVKAAAGDLTIRNTVGGDVTAQVERLRLESGAVVSGKLDYTSRNEVVIASGASVAGTTVRHTPSDTGVAGPGADIFGWLRWLVGLFALGLLLVLLFPAFSRAVVQRLEASPWASLGIGAALLIVAPLLALFVFIVGIFVGGWWLGLFIVAGYLLALALGYVVAGLLVGRFGFDRLGWGNAHRAWQLLGGLVVLSLVGLIPVIGGLANFAACLFGLGALGLVVLQRRTQPA